MDSLFRQHVKEYVELHDQLRQAASTLSDLRKKRDMLASHILTSMRVHHIDECTLTDGKLLCKTSKRTTPLKKEHILQCLSTFLPTNRAQDVFAAMMARRTIKHAEILVRTRSRS